MASPQLTLSGEQKLVVLSQSSTGAHFSGSRGLNTEDLLPSPHGLPSRLRGAGVPLHPPSWCERGCLFLFLGIVYVLSGIANWLIVQWSPRGLLCMHSCQL